MYIRWRRASSDGRSSIAGDFRQTIPKVTNSRSSARAMMISRPRAPGCGDLTSLSRLKSSGGPGAHLTYFFTWAPGAHLASRWAAVPGTRPGHCLWIRRSHRRHRSRIGTNAALPLARATGPCHRLLGSAVLLAPRRRSRSREAIERSYFLGRSSLGYAERGGRGLRADGPERYLP
jgi:hypothetical protein